ncbi:hypothetical protein EJ03DRAFT_351164 [Teratosphaeria nubilosa]|uniref:Uncharacterized protein n=1 Tax=Teratosphaeria nubilosa TaxID=161662 RepID=A0A6G1LB70_9PEZI|nr:hypothetical protein EJ03DRAFT_351164 [Teratosphaeria nubilosa]
MPPASTTLRAHLTPTLTQPSAANLSPKRPPSELCQKGYARMNDFEAHEGSYDHQHRKRLKEMKQLTKDPNAASKAERERKANEEAGLKTINLNLSSAGAAPAAKKKPVFKSTLQPQNATSFAQSSEIEMRDGGGNDNDFEADLEAAYEADIAQARTNGWWGEMYDPRFPSGGRRLLVDPRRAVPLAGEEGEGWEGYVRRAVERLGREGKVVREVVGV